MPSPYVSQNDAFALDSESEQAISQLPPEMQEVAKRGLAALQSGSIPKDAHPELTQRGMAAMQPPPAPSSAQPSGMSPYGVPGLQQAGPPTEAQAAAANARAVQAQFPQKTASPFMPDSVPQMARGSGGSASEATSLTGEHKESNTHKGLADPDAVRNLLDAYSKTPAVRGAQEGIQRQEDQLAMMQRPKGMLEGANLGPLMALQDHFLGSNMAGSYKAPETSEAQQQRIMTAMEKIQTARDSLANNQAHVVGAGSGGLTGSSDAYIENLKKMLAYKDPQMVAGAGLPLRAANEFNLWTRGKLSSNDKAAESLGEVLAEVRSGNPIDDKRMAILRAKIDAGGRPNIAEVGMESGDRDLLEQARQTVSSLMGGKMTPHNRTLMIRSLETIMQEKQKERDIYIAQLRAQGTAQYQQSPEQLEAALPSDYTKSFAKYLGQAAAAHRQIEKGGNGTMNPAPKAKKSTGLLSPDEWLKTQ